MVESVDSIFFCAFIILSVEAFSYLLFTALSVVVSSVVAVVGVFPPSPGVPCPSVQ